jgi:hypothetical protein
VVADVPRPIRKEDAPKGVQWFGLIGSRLMSALFKRKYQRGLGFIKSETPLAHLAD